MTPRNDRIEDLHPIAREAFMRLSELLVAEATRGRGPLFLLFEGYRDPARQAEEVRQGDSKAKPWSSAHQYGLAADFVPYINGEWTWDAPDSAWRFLERCARDCGLHVPIAWDKVHVQHPAWLDARAAMRKR